MWLYIKHTFIANSVFVCVRQVTQLMLGLMVMSYSIPLHLTEVTEVVRLLVPWWSGLAVL